MEQNRKSISKFTYLSTDFFLQRQSEHMLENEKSLINDGEETRDTYAEE